MQSKFVLAWLAFTLAWPCLAQEPSGNSTVARSELLKRAELTFYLAEQARETNPELALTKLEELEQILDQGDKEPKEVVSAIADFRSSLANARQQIGRVWPSLEVIERRLAANPAAIEASDVYAAKVMTEIKRNRPNGPDVSLKTLLTYHDTARGALERGQRVLRSAHDVVADGQAKIVLADEIQMLGMQQRQLDREAGRLAQEGRQFPNRPRNLDELFDQSGLRDHKLASRLKRGQEDASLADTRVLLIATNAESQLARQLIALRYFFTDSFKLPPDGVQSFGIALAGYRVVWANTTSEANECRTLLEKHKVKIPGEKEAVFLVLDNQGTLVAATSTADLQTEEKFDVLRLTKFLEQHAVNMAERDAEQLLDAAYAQAKRDGKRVLLQISGPGCAPCIKLKRYLREQETLVQKDYVCVVLDGRMTNSRRAIDRLGKRVDSIPWFAILDADAKLLTTSVGPRGNIGYPYDPLSIRHFESMLRSTAQNLNADEIKKLIAALEND
ncbi:thioredoxin family protein [Anatilimnocola floriformis]|uniref:thioredoxin family protein n=1 Tax=Anatilimnocola floriformis TaxID=2948575 RepID=UPI0020C45DDC|nr:thioredoxin family protein [Anatilimnocola floriformis]